MERVKVYPETAAGGSAARGRASSGRIREEQSTVAGHAGGLARGSCEPSAYRSGCGAKGWGRPGWWMRSTVWEETRVHEPRSKGKSHVIPKRLVWDAWLKVKDNGGAAGADGVSIEQFEEDLKGNLFRLWNRMSSGSYFPGPVRAVEIPRRKGIRVLGIPNVVDRVAQTTAAMASEPSVEPVFHEELLRIPSRTRARGRGRGLPGALFRETGLSISTSEPSLIRFRGS